MTQKQKEVARVRLNDHSDLVATIVDNQKLDLRVFVNTDSYQGPTKRDLWLYLFDRICEEFKKLVDKMDHEYQKLA